MNLVNIGTSDISYRFIKAYLEQELGDYCGCYSRSRDTADAFIGKLAVSGQSFDNFEDLYNSDFDTIYIASPNSVHYQQCKQALSNGKHVICEKPIVIESDQWQELVDLAKKQGVYIFEAITVHHLPNFFILKQGLKDIGTVKLANFQVVQYSARYSKLLAGEKSNIFSKELAGGAYNDLGVYTYHIAYGLFGKGNSQDVLFNYYQDIDTSGVSTIKYDDFIVSLAYGKDCDSKMISIIAGEKGYLEIIGSLGRIPEVYLIRNELRELISVKNNENHLSYEIIEFARIIREKDEKAYLRLQNITTMVVGWMAEGRVIAEGNR